MCFDHPYSGIFDDFDNRKAAYIGVAGIEILMRSLFAAIAAIEFVPIVKEHLRPELVPVLPFIFVYVFLSIVHCLAFRGPHMLLAQMLLMTVAHAAFVLLMVSVLSWTKSESWNPRGLITFSFAVVAIMKFFGSTMLYCDLVDMSSDYGYLTEFFFGVTCVAAGVAWTFFIEQSLLAVTAAVGSLCGTILSMISLFDLHQNMSINYWWWEQQIIRGCIYHVLRQYTLLCCLRTEDPPDVLVLVNDSRETRPRTTSPRQEGS